MNNKQLTDNLKTILNLEWLGVRIEDTREEKDMYGLTCKTAYYYSVPESSTIELDNKELNSRIKTADGLKKLAKETLIDMLIKSCQAEYEDEEFIKDLKDNTSDYFRFYAKVRQGEVWTEEMGFARLKEFREEINRAAQWKEV